MFKALRIMGAVTLLAGAVASQAGAAVQYLSVDWDEANMRTINYTFDGALRTLRVAPATGYIDGVLDGLFTTGGRTISKMFCVDLFNVAYDSRSEAGNNHEYSVNEYTQTDGLDGWTTPVGHATDRFRDLGNLSRVAWCVDNLAPGATEADQTVALNLVIWKAAYGDRFEYVSGLRGGEQEHIYSDYLTQYQQGHTSSVWHWYDNAFGDGDDQYQDFVQLSSPETPPVPEPGTVMMLGMGLLGMGRFVRRRVRSS